MSYQLSVLSFGEETERNCWKGTYLKVGHYNRKEMVLRREQHEH
jgi:hypothetical protein